MIALQRNGPQAAGPLAEYEALLVERFELSPERARCLRVLLASYEREVEELRSQRLLETDLSPGPEIAMKSQEYDRLIREKVLPPGQRAEFLELCRPLPFSAQ